MVPEHWQVLPNRAIYSEVNDRGHAQEQMLAVTISKGVISQQELLEDSSKKDSSRLDRSGYKLVQPGDIAYNKMRAWQGALGVSGYRGIISPAYVVQRPRTNAHARYLHFLLRTPAFAKEAERWSYGITSDMWSLRPEHFKMIYSCIPPLLEQTAIACFLDHMDHRIQKYIRAKEKLIALLDEYKQALIHQAVTGQIDVRTSEPYSEYKESGAEWLGRVPGHWDVAPLKWVSDRSQNGSTPPTSEARHYEDGTVPWYGPSSCGDSEEVGRPTRLLNKLAFAKGAAAFIRGPALLIVVIGTTGKMTVMPQDGSTNQQITAFELSSDRVIPIFLLYQLRLSEKWLRSTASTATIPILDSDVVNRLPCAIPSLPEQTTIAQSLRQIADRLDRVRASNRRQIDFIQEYRIRLVSDVVTGKLDVREVAATLPNTDPPQFWRQCKQTH